MRPQVGIILTGGNRMLLRCLASQRHGGSFETPIGGDMIGTDTRFQPIAMAASTMEPRLFEIEAHHDPRGALVCLESGVHAPFAIKRVFFIFDVPPKHTRGGHETRCQELLIALRGTCRVATVQKGVSREFVLSAPTQVLHVPRGVWLELDRFAPGTLVAVAADQPYVAR